jgi:hypothetical protein
MSLAVVLQMMQGSIATLEASYKHAEAQSSIKIAALEQQLETHRDHSTMLIRQLESDARALEQKVRKLEGDVLRNVPVVTTIANISNGGSGGGTPNRVATPTQTTSSARTPAQFIRIMRDYHVQECPQSQRGISHDWSQCDPLLVHRAPGRPLPLRRDPRKPRNVRIGHGESPWYVALCLCSHALSFLPLFPLFIALFGACAMTKQSSLYRSYG